MNVVSLPKHVAKHIEANKIEVVGLLASPTSIKHNLHLRHIMGTPVLVLGHEQQLRTEDMIRGVIAGSDHTKTLKKQIQMLRQKGAQKVILGCTELSVINDSLQSKHVIDPLDLVVEVIFKS